MQNETKVSNASIRLSTVATTTRQTPKTDFGTVMRDGLIKAGGVVSEGLAYASPYVPGAQILSAALSGASSAANMTPSYVGSAGGAAYGAGGGAAGGNAAFGVSRSGLTAPGAGPAGGGSAAVGNYGANGTLAVPGRSPGYSTDLNQSASNFAGSYGTGQGAGASDAFNSMMGATRQMAEFQASFNLQYLQLQEKIQTDTRQFNLISNIMKTKHDAAKNALNNVR